MRALGWAVLCSRMRVTLTAQSKDPTCSYTNSPTFLSRALKETALWQDATPISQNRDWIEWMSCETAADLKHCYKSQTARSAAARLGRDRQPDIHTSLPQPCPPQRTNSMLFRLRLLLYPLATMRCETTTLRKMYHDRPPIKHHT